MNPKIEKYVEQIKPFARFFRERNDGAAVMTVGSGEIIVRFDTPESDKVVMFATRSSTERAAKFRSAMPAVNRALDSLLFYTSQERLSIHAKPYASDGKLKVLIHGSFPTGYAESYTDDPAVIGMCYAIGEGGPLTHLLDHLASNGEAKWVNAKNWGTGKDDVLTIVRTIKVTVTDDQGVVLDNAQFAVPVTISELSVSYGGPGSGVTEEVVAELTIGKAA